MGNIRIFTKVDGELLCWETDATLDNYEEMIEEVRKEIDDPKHQVPILALVKY